MLERPRPQNAATSPSESLTFPFDAPPPTGEVAEVAPGILWARIPLPFQLDHVNIYLIEDGNGWAVLDTGIADRQTREVWQALLSGPLAGRRLTRLIVTHFHPDHIGLAGWLCEQHGLSLLTSQTTYLSSINISLSPAALEAKPYRDFYRHHGMSDETAALVSTQGHRYLHMVAQLPPTFERVVAGDTLTIGGRRFEVLSGDGHAPEQLMFHLPEENVFLAADQVLEKISPNVSVWAVDPDGDPLGLYLRSLTEIPRRIPADALVLPGHRLPFYGLHARCGQLAGHHQERCGLIAAACGEAPKSVAELVPVVFHRPLDPHQLSFAFSEVHAHVNTMIRRGDLAWTDTPEGTRRAVLAR